MNAIVPHCAALVLAVAVTQLLGGCAGAPAGGAPATDAGTAAAAAPDSPGELTGSRIPARRTEKMVTQIGGQDYKNDRIALPAPLTAH